jgi:hypothetical protein
MPLRSSEEFIPYILKHVPYWKTNPTNVVPTSIDVQPLVRIAVTQEDQRFEEGADDSEGFGISSRPSSPLTELESDWDDDSKVPDPPVEDFSLPVEQKRKKESAKTRRAQKRAKRAASDHRPHSYAANPTTATHHAQELPPLQVPVDAETFPASASGSWVGKRTKGTSKKPWTVPELLHEDFRIIEWDGR